MMMEAAVKDELEQFLISKNISAESLSSVDEIVLGYIVSVLEQLGEDQEFDVNDFVEMMAAYIPRFDTVSREHVYSWLLDLAEKLVKARTSSNLTEEDNVVMTEDTCKCHRSPSSLEGDVLPCDDAVKEHQIGNSLALSSLERLCMNGGFDESSVVTLSLDSTHNNQETDINEQNVDSESAGNNESFSEDALVLAEMFPEASSLEIRNCLTVAIGNLESVVQLMLLKKENIDDEGKENCCQVLDLSPKVHRPSSKRQELQEAEQQNLKEQMMARYGYIEVSQEEKTHQPTLREQGEKKLVRYRNNQVVSNKGERFSYVKQEESEEMKKTYVNIKPARKYRFH